MNEEYFGFNLSTDEYEVILHSRWDDKQVKEELKLFSRKWWDYRHQHPVNSTYLFAHIFTRETRAIIRKHIDNTPPKVTAKGTVIDWHPLKSGDVFDPPSDVNKLKGWKRKTKSLIKARQTADRFGIPYEFFIKAGLKHYYFGRFYIFEEHRTLPSPEMLTSDDCLVAIAEAWLQELESRIHYGTHERYLIANDAGHTDVVEHQKSILNQINRKTNPIPALSKFLKLGYLSERAVRDRYGEDRLQKSLALVAE